MYDPLADRNIQPQQAAVNSYWEAQTRVAWPASEQAPQYTDNLVIGGGYTGLNTAITLAESYQQDVTVIDANRIGWGCSSRNAGFAMASTGRLGLSHWAKARGERVAAAIANEHQQALDLLQQRLQQRADRCDQQSGGYIKLAHSPSSVEELAQQYRCLRQFQQDVSWLDADQARQYLNTRYAYAGLRFNQCFAINPLKLAASNAQLAAEHGVKLVSNCAAESIERLAEGWRVQTSSGAIDCAKLYICTNAYTANRLVPALKGRSLPALSSIIVTPPLTEQQLQDTGLTADYAFMDTRTLKYYFRLLPDNRLLFGGRGAIRGKDADKLRYAEHLLSALKASFKGLQQLDSWDYFWSGWVSVAFDDYPRVGDIGDNLYAAMGYCGAGVSYSGLAGKRLAQRAMGDALPDLPYYQTPLKPFPLPMLRRLGQWAFYHYARITE